MHDLYTNISIHTFFFFIFSICSPIYRYIYMCIYRQLSYTPEYILRIYFVYIFIVRSLYQFKQLVTIVYTGVYIYNSSNLGGSSWSYGPRVNTQQQRGQPCEQSLPHSERRPAPATFCIPPPLLRFARYGGPGPPTKGRCGHQRFVQRWPALEKVGSARGLGEGVGRGEHSIINTF